MKFDILTIFPSMIQGFLQEGVVGRAASRGLLDVVVRDLRAFTADPHRTVDDVPYGGGPGMVMKAEPFVGALDHVGRTRGVPDAVVLMSPQGQRLTHAEADRLSKLSHVVLLCGDTKRWMNESGSKWRRRSCRSATTCSVAVSCRRWSRWTPSGASFLALLAMSRPLRRTPSCEDCWTTRTILVRGSSTGVACQRCCSRGIMPRSGTGESGKL